MSDGLTIERVVAIKLQGKTFNITFPLSILELIDQLVREKKYDNRSHIMRLGLKMLLESEGLLEGLPTLDELDKYTISKLSRSARDFLPVGDENNGSHHK